MRPPGSIPPRASVPAAALAAMLMTQGCYAETSADDAVPSAVIEALREDPRDADVPVAARGTWVWGTRDRLDDPEAAKVILETCRESRLNEVYLSVGGGALKHPAMPALLAALYDAGVRVEALMGEADWSMPEHRHEMLARIDEVAAFNAQHGGKIAAIHLDIEPHQLPSNRNNHAFLPQLAETLRVARARAGAAGMSTSADLPRFALDLHGPLFAQAVDRPFVMLYQLHDRSPDSLARQSAAVVEATYLGTHPGLRGRLVVAIRVEDYGRDTAPRARGLDDAHGAVSRYGGWAIHDEAKLRAARAAGK
ncbi:hypothetical protein BH11MYX4_BH11MYX4_37150 [soil metagenome]